VHHLDGWIKIDQFDVTYVDMCFSLHKDTTPPQPNHTVTPTHIEPEQYNTWNKSTVSRNLLKMDVLTFETCWAVNSEIIKQVTSSWSIFIQVCNKFRVFNSVPASLQIDTSVSCNNTFASQPHRTFGFRPSVGQKEPRPYGNVWRQLVVSSPLRPELF